MSEFRPGQVAQLLGVSVDTVRRWCDDGTLPTERTQNGRRVIRGRDLAGFLTRRERTEPDLSLRQSARNRFTGIVTRVERDKLTAIIELRSGPNRLVSLMTSEAADELGLEPGDLAVAVVKSTNVIIEAPVGT